VLRLTAARRGAILASLVILLALMLDSQQPVAQQYTPTSTPAMTYTVYEDVAVRARDLKRYEFYVCDGCHVVIYFYVHDTTWRSSDIIFRALDPKGREIYPRGKVSTLEWGFIAERPGTYILEFDNTYSATDKLVKLSISVRSLERTTIMIGYGISTVTITKTLTITPPILSWEGMLILTLVATVAFMVGVLLALLVRRS
jgi:hypothetical protein